MTYMLRGLQQQILITSHYIAVEYAELQLWWMNRTKSCNFSIFKNKSLFYIYRCKCGHCEIMPTITESICCHDIPEVLARMEEEFSEVEGKCITEHEGFDPVCLNPHTLRTAYFAYRQQYNVNRNDALHERYRYTGYRQFVRWCWGYLGKDIVVTLPACVVITIRKTYPSADGSYKGNKMALPLP